MSKTKINNNYNMNLYYYLPIIEKTIINNVENKNKQ